MNKYLYLLKYEAKSIIRDPMNLYMCFFPVIMLLLSVFVFPIMLDSIDPGKASTMQITVLLLLIMLLAFGSFFLAAMGTFLLLENKDECTINTIAVTPLGTTGYVKFKMTYIYVMSILSSIIILLGTKLFASDKYAIGDVSLFDSIGIIEIVSFSLVSSLFVPTLALLQSAFAKNKVEGFAFIKGTGIIALIPAIMILEAFHGRLQYLLGIFPNFWAIKGIMLELFPIQSSANLSYPLYLLIGTAYNILLMITAYRMFLKKVSY